MSNHGNDMRSRPNSQSGLTLVELVVVLAVLGIVTALVTPAVTSLMPGYQLRATADDIVSQIRYARSLSFESNRPAGFFVDTGEGLTFAEGATPRFWPKDIAVTFTSAKFLQRGDTVGEIRFYPDGTSTGGLLDLSGNGRTVRIRVDWFDGEISVDTLSSDVTDS